MKIARIIIIFIFLLAFWQSNAQRKTYLGLKGGANYGTADLFHSFNGYNFTSGFVSGFQGGVVVMNFLRNHVGIQAEALYVQKGWIQKFGNGKPDFGTYLDFIEVPLLVNVHTGKKALHFFANAGCFFEYLVKSSQDEPPLDGFEDGFFPFDENRDLKFGYGFKAGGGSFYDFNFGTILLEVNASYSLSSIYEPGSLATGIPNVSNKINVGVSLGYLFSFGSFGEQ